MIYISKAQVKARKRNSPPKAGCKNYIKSPFKKDQLENYAVVTTCWRITFSAPPALNHSIC